MSEHVNYVCTECGAHTVKLWREIHSGKVLRCVDCACKRVGIDPDKVSPGGKYDNEETGLSDQLYSSKTGVNLLPAVPDDTWTTFWGYTSVPEDGCAWWRYMPLRRPPLPKAHKYDVLHLKALMRDGAITKRDLQAALDEVK